MDYRIYWFWLSLSMDYEVHLMNLLLEYFLTPDNIFYCSKKTLIDMKLTDRQVDMVISNRNEKEIIKRYREMEQKNIKMLCFGEKGFPDFSYMGYYQPRVLYYKGSFPDVTKPFISIVGARNASVYGKYMAEKLGREAAMAGIDTVSGMAMGIDACGHKGTLDGNGRTYAVLGSGVDVCYPPSNHYLYERIIETGGIISEYVPGTPPNKIRFPLRNRIISGLSDKIIVVEAKEKSGSLITVEYGLQQGKDIYAVPGKATDSLSEGCNNLIKSGAGIITEIEDILWNKWELEYKNNDSKAGNKSNDFTKIATLKDKIRTHKNQNVQEKKINMVLEKDLQVVYSNVDLLPLSLEDIVRKSRMEARDVVSILGRLQLMGIIKENYKNYYSKV